MSGKYKATGCARFFLFLIIILPVAYFGAKYLSDNGIIDGLEERFDSNDDSADIEEETYVPTNSTDPNLAKLERKMQQLIETVKEQQTTIKNQEKTINSQQDLIEQMKAQLKSGASASAPTTSSPAPTTQSSNGESLEELLKEADKALKNNKN